MFLDFSSRWQQPSEACSSRHGKGRGLWWCLLGVLMVVLPGCWAAMLGSSSVRWPAVAHVQSPPLGVCGGLSAGTTGKAAMHGEDAAHAAGAGARGPH